MPSQVDIGWKGGLTMDELGGPARGWIRGEAEAVVNKRSQYTPTTEQQQDAAAVARALATRIETVALALLGRPTSKRGTQWRWGRRGSIAVHIYGDQQGRWYSFEEARGGDALDLVAFATGEPLRCALGWARSFLGSAPAPYLPAMQRPANPGRRTSSPRALDIWENALPLGASPAALYLENRGVQLDEWPADLRFHPACPFGDERAPCLIALVRDIRSDKPVGIHRTAIKSDGSGKLFDGERAHENKKALGSIGGGVVKLSPDDVIGTGLALCEGIETGLSLLAIGWPMWCTLGTSGLMQFRVISGVECLTIFADHDASGAGEKAAVACGTRWRAAGRDIQILRPRTRGADWNDTLRAVQ
jgi:putative DNA primase/helicase